MTTASFVHLSDRDLLAEVRGLARQERRATVELIAALTEVDARRLYLGEGCSSLFTYCTQVLRLSEHAAYGRIEAARAARRFPVILDRLADGSLTLTTACLLAPHLTAANHRDVLAEANHKSKREVEHLVASLAPRPAVPASIRKLPASRPLAPPSPELALARASDDTETGFLEFHHVEPYALRGRTVVDNLQLRCRAHNLYEAEECFAVGLPLLRERQDRYSVRSGPSSTKYS